MSASCRGTGETPAVDRGEWESDAAIAEQLSVNRIR